MNKDRPFRVGAAEDLVRLRSDFEELVEQDLQNLELGSSRLEHAFAAILKSQGKRLRPLCVCLIADALGRHKRVDQAALSVEYFHLASLIADDLPCMDNDPVRRGQPALHTVFGEETALLVSYALIAAAYEKIHQSMLDLTSHVPDRDQRLQLLEGGLIALKSACQGSGLKGAVAGQFWDLSRGDQGATSLASVIGKKTGLLFEVAFLFGWIFGGGGLDRLPLVKQAGHHFGMTLQLRDDLQDERQDEQTGRNSCFEWGRDRVLSQITQHKQKLTQLLEGLDLLSSPFAVLVARI